MVICTNNKSPADGHRYFSASYFSDGQLLTYGGALADTETEDELVAEYKGGGIVSVQMGRIPRTQATKKMPFPQWIEAPSPFRENIDEKDFIPYCIFFRQGEMVHKPLVCSNDSEA